MLLAYYEGFSREEIATLMLEAGLDVTASRDLAPDKLAPDGGASLTVSIMNDDRLWGLIACHHETPRRISAATSAAVAIKVVRFIVGQPFPSEVAIRRPRSRCSAPVRWASSD